MNYELRISVGAFSVILLLWTTLAAFGQTAHYRKDGRALLPDSTASPGVVEIRDKSQLCPVAHTAARRNVTPEEKQQVCDEYGIPRSKCNGRNYEIDHIISLELGGSNAIRNLFPQPWWPHPGAHDKDHLENWLHSQVCAEKISLEDAQKGISSDWYRLYLQMNKGRTNGER